MLRANRHSAVLNVRDRKLFGTVEEAAKEYGTRPAVISASLYDGRSDFRRVRRVYRVRLASGEEHVCYSSREKGFMRLVRDIFEYVKVGKNDSVTDITLEWYSR